MRISDWSSDVCSSDLEDLRALASDAARDTWSECGVAGRPDHPGEAEAVVRKRGRMNIDMPAGDRAVVQHPHSRNVADDKAQLDLFARHDLIAEDGFAGGPQSPAVDGPCVAGRHAPQAPHVRVESTTPLVDQQQHD